MRLTGADSDRDRLTEQRRSGSVGGWALNLVIGALLILFGFAIAIFGVLAGVISQGQLVALFSGTGAERPVSTSGQTAGPADAVPPAAEATPAVGQARVLRDETFGDWRFVCVEVAEGATASCSAMQQLRVAESGAAVFVWRIVQDGRGGLVGVWQVTEAVLESEGLTLDAGTPQPVVMPFESCGSGSCRVVANLAPDFIETLSSAETLSASVVLSNQQDLTFPLSPDGLDDALRALAE